MTYIPLHETLAEQAERWRRERAEQPNMVWGIFLVTCAAVALLWMLG